MALFCSFFWGETVNSGEEIIFTFVFFLYVTLTTVVLRALSLSGALAAAIIGTHLTAMSGLGIWPMVWFFVTGTLLTRLPGKSASDANSGKPRNAVQVLANGGMALFLSVIAVFSDRDIELLYHISIAIACADTWGSEIGSRWGRRTFDMKNFKPIPAGVSGGISLAGTMATLCGAMVIAAFSPDLNGFFVVTAAGVAGAMADSLAGSLWQAKYLDARGILSDLKHGKIISGKQWMSNDLVNFLSNGSVTLLFALIL